MASTFTLEANLIEAGFTMAEAEEFIREYFSGEEETE